MSEEQLKAFIAKAKNDQTIQEKLKAAKTSEDVVGIAKEHGHEFTADMINAESLKVKLSDEELESLAGGHAYSYTCTDRTACGSKGPDYVGLGC